jgi:hypothetical protein
VLNRRQTLWIRCVVAWPKRRRSTARAIPNLDPSSRFPIRPKCSVAAVGVNGVGAEDFAGGEVDDRRQLKHVCQVLSREEDRPLIEGLDTHSGTLRMNRDSGADHHALVIKSLVMLGMATERDFRPCQL